MDLPKELLTAIHDLFVLCYMTSSTPASSKKSQQVHLYKKIDPLDNKNYRPIALADTRTKLYAGLLTAFLAGYAEHHDILSTSQKLFRRAKGAAVCSSVQAPAMYGACMGIKTLCVRSRMRQIDLFPSRRKRRVQMPCQMERYDPSEKTSCHT